MKHDHDARALLERIGVLRHPSDLDLLLFFARHPRTLLPSEQLSTFVGYGLKEIAASLDLLVDAGLVIRAQSQRHPARMFMLAEIGPRHGWFPDLLTLTRTREGRLAMIWALRGKADRAGDPSARVTSPPIAPPRPRPFLVERQADSKKRTKAK